MINFSFTNLQNDQHCTVGRFVTSLRRKRPSIIIVNVNEDIALCVNSDNSVSCI